MKLSTLAQIGFPFHPFGRPCGNPAMYRLRVAARAQQLKRHPFWKRLFARLVIASLWPVGAAKATLQYGIEQRARPMRILEAWWLALRHNVPPVEYFFYRLWEPDRRARLDDYLYWTESSSALAALNHEAGCCEGRSPVEDKYLFHQFCIDFGLPTPSLFGVWELGSQTSGGALPENDLWVKPVKSSGAIGAEKWLWCGNGYRNHDTTLCPDQMAIHIARHSNSHRKTLVQQVVHAHEDHAPLIGDAPLCVRIITGRRRSGEVEVIDAMAIWPQRGVETTIGGHIAMINMATGRLGTVYEVPENDPATQMDNKLLPDWPSLVDDVRRGHANLGQWVFLGWDVAIGQDGPVFLETNSGWGSFHLQVVPDRPIADTAFASIAGEYI